MVVSHPAVPSQNPRQVERAAKTRAESEVVHSFQIAPAPPAAASGQFLPMEAT
jgi:anti-sigma factor RsiW